MFDSGIKAVDLINGLKDEVDIALPLSDYTYITYLNSLEQLLYSEIIKEQKKIIIENPAENIIDLNNLDVSEGENKICFEDIYTAYADDTQLIKSTVTSGEIFPNTFYKTENALGFNIENMPNKLIIVYFVRPRLKTVDCEDNVMLPLEHTELANAKLRGEAYKLINEDALAAKWLNDYNVLLENFKAWITARTAQFGM